MKPVYYNGGVIGEAASLAEAVAVLCAAGATIPRDGTEQAPHEGVAGFYFADALAGRDIIIAWGRQRMAARFANFLVDNGDGLAPAVVIGLHNALRNDRLYRGGGGAAPEWTVAPVIEATVPA